MKSLTLPRTDLLVSSVCLGTAESGAGIPEAEAFALFDQFLEAGGNFLDTAAVYADWTPAGKGSSEKLIGKWLKNAAKNVIVATKGGHPELHSMGIGRLSRTEIEDDLNQSLSNLGLENIDLYYLHRDDSAVEVEELLQILEDQKRAGKIRYYACSNWKAARIEAADVAAKAMGISGFIANQPLWSLAQADLTGGDQTLATMNDELYAYHLAAGMAVIPYASQANGYFQKIADSKELPPSVSAFYDSELVRPINRGRFTRMEKMAGTTGLSLSALVIAFLQNQPFPVVPIVGCRTKQQLSDTLAAVDVELDAEQLRVLAG